MHAFDREQLDEGIIVRRAAAKEQLALLDGSTQTMSNDTLVIADAGGAIAMAGIMGGEDSAISTRTRNIVLESAFFTPGAVAGKARSYSLHTDSSHRFERGVDPELPFVASHYATSLLKADHRWGARSDRRGGARQIPAEASGSGRAPRTHPPIAGHGPGGVKRRRHIVPDRCHAGRARVLAGDAAAAPFRYRARMRSY